ncbi:unnamed protein product, partial [Rodentolepis nana]|uniref:Uncharacterized protein n=1 Tax=Rodentolepis nana TaxID=102285 RepID=A0A0R3TCK4_RODNA
TGRCISTQWRPESEATSRPQGATNLKLEQRNSGQLALSDITDWPGIEAVADWPRIEAVAEFNFGQESKPLLSLDYVPDGLPGKTPSKIGRGNGEVPPVYVTYRRKRRRPTICNLHEEMEKTHLIRSKKTANVCY